MKIFKINDKEEAKLVRKSYLYSRIFLIVLLMYYVFITKQSIMEIATNYDGQNYLTIAKYGYVKKHLYAFFPMLPILIGLSLKIFNSYLPIILLLNLLVYFTGIAIYNLTKNYYSDNPKIPKLLSDLWFFSPMAVYTTVLYTESLYCFISVCILWLYKRKEKPILMGVLMGLLVCTRNTGALLFFTIFICITLDYFINKGKDFYKELKYIISIYIPATIISCLYPIYLHITLGNWRYFIDVQYEYWSKKTTTFITMIFREIHAIISGRFAEMNEVIKTQFITQSIAFYIVLIVLIMGIYLTIKNKKLWIKKELVLFAILNICVFGSVYTIVGAPSTSYYRYLLSCISIYLLVDDEKKVKNMFRLSIFLNMFVAISHFMSGYLF